MELEEKVRTKVKRKVNDNVKCKDKKSKQMKLDISSDNLNSIYINNKRCVVNTLSERNQMPIKQKVLVYKTSTHNENMRKSSKRYANMYNTENIKTNPNELNSDDLNKFLNTNEPNPSSLNINKIDEPSIINHSFSVWRKRNFAVRKKRRKISFILFTVVSHIKIPNKKQVVTI